MPVSSETFLEPCGRYLTRDQIDQDDEGEITEKWPQIRSKGTLEVEFILV